MVLLRGLQTLREEGVKPFMMKTNRYVSERIRKNCLPTWLDDDPILKETIESTRGEQVYYEVMNSLFNSPLPEHSEAETMGEFWSNIEKGDVFWDIGAGHRRYPGRYCRLANLVTEPGGVYAFEPNPEIYKNTEKVINQLESEPSRAFEIALGSEDNKTIDFATEMPAQSSSSAGAIKYSPEQEKEANVEEVIQRTGDELIMSSDILPPDAIKIDVEGAELDVLQGLQNTLSTERIRFIICEIHTSENRYTPSIENFGSKPEDVHKYLSSYGYSIDTIQERKNDYHIIAKSDCARVSDSSTH